MANAVRKWLPLALVAGAIAATGLAVRDLPPAVAIDLRGVLPFSLESSADTAPRWVAVFGIPILAALVWALFQLGRSRSGLRLTRRLFPGTPEALGDPATIDRFRATYDSIVLWVVTLVLGVHAGMIAAALGHETLAPRIISVVMGVSLIAAGNVMPRLRPNVVAGVRTRRALTDPHLWRATHRVLGVAFVVAGAITIVVGLVAPRYGLTAAVIGVIVACIVATVGGLRARHTAAVAVAVLVVTLSTGTGAAHSPNVPAVQPLPPHPAVEQGPALERNELASSVPRDERLAANLQAIRRS